MTTSPVSPRRTRISALGAVLATLTLSGCSPAESTDTTLAPALNVVTAPVTAATGYQASRTYTGRVEARRTSEVGFEIGGKLVEVLVDEGDAVTAGQVLARLDTGRLVAHRAELKAALDQALAQSELAAATLERTEEALAYKGVSRQTFDEASNAATSLGAAVAVARARIQTVNVDLAKSALTAPYDAVVIRRALDEGAVLAAGQPVLSLQSTEPPRARIGVAADVADRFVNGSVHPVDVEQHRIEGTVAAVIPRRDAQTRTVDVLLDLDDSRIGARPGDIARVSVDQHVQTAGFWVPLGALAEGPRGLWTNYAVETVTGEPSATHRVVPRTVEVLHTETRRAYVRGTLKPGDRLVIDGLQRVVPGQLVTLTDADDDPRVASRLEDPQ